MAALPSQRFSPPASDSTEIALGNVPADLIERLRCPVTDTSVRPMNDRELEDLNAAARRSDAAHLDGSAVDGQITAALVNDDASLAYRVEDGILMMLPNSAIALDRASAARHGSAHRPEKRAVQSFYDQIGWKRDEKGDFEDAVIWEDLRPVSADYIRKCHLRVNRYLQPTGDYLLDVASGPVQYPEYLTYSQGYKRRICMDISVQALREARRKVGDKGVYILGDITNLPIKTDALDAVISLHTIYHVPQDEQGKAFEELYRVLRPGRSGVIVYTFSDPLLLRWGNKPARWWKVARKSLPARAIKKLLGRKPAPQADPGKKADSANAPFYFHAHPLSWFTSRKWSFPIDVVVWRSVNVWSLRTYAHPKRLGRLLLAAIYGFEQLFPRFTGRHGPYPMFLLRKL
ncbi:MAG TPA: methyltransferase domain-containing protein [Tepidisphaeraceae bacterium]|nr:methyltransferase domain-containing protein [Tepidisphaeraceae bacterium]